MKNISKKRNISEIIQAYLEARKGLEKLCEDTEKNNTHWFSVRFFIKRRKKSNTRLMLGYIYSIEQPIFAALRKDIEREFGVGADEVTQYLRENNDNSQEVGFEAFQSWARAKNAALDGNRSAGRPIPASHMANTTLLSTSLPIARIF